MRQDARTEGLNGAPALDRGFAWYVLGLLTFAYALAYIDRQLLNLVVDPIKQSLVISDTELSFVQGFAFISAYIAAAPIFGRLADITNRRNILMFGVSIWSLATAACGFAENYAELLVARFLVGVAEASVFPISWSLIPEFFSQRRTPRATSIFMMGGQIGGAISLLAGGAVIAFAASLRDRLPVIADRETWQVAFIVIGLSGLLFAALLFSFGEPPRRKLLGAEDTESRFGLRDGWHYLWQRRGFYGRIYLGIGCIGIVFLGIPAWYPSYLIRVHGFSPVDVGVRFGSVTLIFGMSGVFLGPWLAQAVEKLGVRDAAFRTVAWSIVPMIVSCLAIPFAGSPTGALVTVACLIFFTSLPTGIIAYSTQLATPGRMRGTAASFYTMFAQIIGYGIGPTLIALLTDRVFRSPDMVGYSLQIVTASAACLALAFYATILSPYRELQAANAGERPPSATD